MLQDGSVQVIDMSNILPHSQVTDIAGLASRGNIKGIADYITSEMIGTQIAASAVLELAQNRDGFDQPIWLDTDGALGASFKMLSHLVKGTVVPSVVDKVSKIGRYGEQMIKFCEEIGFELMPWQQWLAHHSLKYKPDGRWAHPVSSGTGSGIVRLSGGHSSL